MERKMSFFQKKSSHSAILVLFEKNNFKKVICHLKDYYLILIIFPNFRALRSLLFVLNYHHSAAAWPLRQTVLENFSLFYLTYQHLLSLQALFFMNEDSKK